MHACMGATYRQAPTGHSHGTTPVPAHSLQRSLASSGSSSACEGLGASADAAAAAAAAAGTMNTICLRVGLMIEGAAACWCCSFGCCAAWCCCWLFDA